MSIRFADKGAESCLGGVWLQLTKKAIYDRR